MDQNQPQYSISHPLARLLQFGYPNYRRSSVMNMVNARIQTTLRHQRRHAQLLETMEVGDSIREFQTRRLHTNQVLTVQQLCAVWHQLRDTDPIQYPLVETIAQMIATNLEDWHDTFSTRFTMPEDEEDKDDDEDEEENEEQDNNVVIHNQQPPDMANQPLAILIDSEYIRIARRQPHLQLLQMEAEQENTADGAANITIRIRARRRI